MTPCPERRQIPGVSGNPVPAEMVVRTSTLEQRAPPAVEQRSSSHSHAGGVLNGRAHKMPLIETGEASFRAQVQPILRDQQISDADAAAAPGVDVGRARGSSHASQHRVIVDGLREGVLDAGRESAVQRRRNWIDPASRVELPFDVIYS
jgi:hypothetical protein